MQRCAAVFAELCHVSLPFRRVSNHCETARFCPFFPVGFSHDFVPGFFAHFFNYFFNIFIKYLIFLISHGFSTFFSHYFFNLLFHKKADFSTDTLFFGRIFDDFFPQFVVTKLPQRVQKTVRGLKRAKFLHFSDF
jgi:hypothetical protein